MLSIDKQSLNVKKTKFMIFHYHQQNIDDLIPDLQINPETIECVTEFNVPLLTLGENLYWNAHNQKVSNKISRTLGVMCRSKSFPPFTCFVSSLQFPYSSTSSIWTFNLGLLPR